ncbi:MAG TPA: hypothetical protein VEW69_12070, partial [Alphaproteobacteria bacterium]|nr:hypothetical protein [Alphaproteobacteria bacterium]
ALPHLLAAVSEEALTELLFQQEPCSLPGLAKYLETPEITSRNLTRAVHVISGILNDEAADLLANVASNNKLDEGARKAAREALSRRTSEHAKDLIRKVEQKLSRPDLGLAGA